MFACRCRLCAFGRSKGADGAYTMALDQAWETAASGYSEAVTEFHIVGVCIRICLSNISWIW